MQSKCDITIIEYYVNKKERKKVICRRDFVHNSGDVVRTCRYNRICVIFVVKL
jgi:hypothetical protein